MKKVLILQGLPASGKSTFAKEILLKEPGRWVRVNKDLLREMAHASYWSEGNEKFIIKLRNQIILMALEEGKHVIIDDTNFGKHIEKIKELVKGKAEVKINDSFFKTPVEECIKRDLKRPNSVGKDVIMKMYNQFILPQVNPPEYNPDLPDAILVDMDGTLSILHNRSPYDVSKCDQDLPNQPVLETVYKWQDSTNIIVLSARTDDGKELTEKWLKQHQVKYVNLYMRKTGDLRKDAIVKQEIYEEYIKDKYNVKFILDDRNQVVEMWRNLGLTVFQVGEGDF
ncbi:AAA family ATPase [Geminocystis sp. GBBB08]|uniref:phosphatase domain-containing protein n=1 Tax=Geminocystis sp. GBBB08 TaxID=2604140 RepID=UPI0027E37BC3|nr:AAA family ATPase [Geminocystis sp. GBBB08]MBL1210413.1 AAA family ATPase [Geminocystis sp. GBBB08]